MGGLGTPPFLGYGKCRVLLTGGGVVRVLAPLWRITAPLMVCTEVAIAFRPGHVLQDTTGVYTVFAPYNA